MELRRVTGLLEMVLEGYVASRTDRGGVYRGDGGLLLAYAGASLYNSYASGRAGSFSSQYSPGSVKRSTSRRGGSSQPRGADGRFVKKTAASDPMPESKSESESKREASAKQDRPVGRPSVYSSSHVGSPKRVRSHVDYVVGGYPFRFEYVISKGKDSTSHGLRVNSLSNPLLGWMFNYTYTLSR